MANYECARCHRFFEKVAFEEVCPACFPVEEEEFGRIKEYLTKHPGASSNEVMQHLGVSLKSIRRYLKEDRLEIVGDNKGFIRCELCGKPVNSGYFCGECYKEGNAKKLRERGLGVKSAYISWDDDSKQNKKGIQYRDRGRDGDEKNKRL
jgi:Zn finger protein HypA/HybF involved in hydrogenase expression